MRWILWWVLLLLVLLWVLASLWWICAGILWRIHWLGSTLRWITWITSLHRWLAWVCAWCALRWSKGIWWLTWISTWSARIDRLLLRISHWGRLVLICILSNTSPHIILRWRCLRLMRTHSSTNSLIYLLIHLSLLCEHLLLKQSILLLILLHLLHLSRSCLCCLYVRVCLFFDTSLWLLSLSTYPFCF